VFPIGDINDDNTLRGMIAVDNNLVYCKGIKVINLSIHDGTLEFIIIFLLLSYLDSASHGFTFTLFW